MPRMRPSSRSASLAAIALASLWLGGCGTIMNFTATGAPHFFPMPMGGVYLDVWLMEGRPELIPLGLVDLPLTFFGDLITLLPAIALHPHPGPRGAPHDPETHKDGALPP